MKNMILTITMAAVSSGVIFAQAPVTPTTPPASNPKVIKARKQNQQKRIAQGVKSGELTPKETAKLERREANLNKTIRNDRAANGGKLTAAERKQVAHRQNNISKDIKAEKHDGQK